MGINGMIEIMSAIALVVGILFGLWVFGVNRRMNISWLLVIFHSSPFSTKQGFYNLYDMSDDEVSFKWYRKHNGSIEKYADYLRLHADARSSAYETFQQNYRGLQRLFVYRLLPILLIPAVLFWKNWYFYLIGVVATFVILFTYELSKNGFRSGFYQRLVVYTVLSNYAKKK